MSCKPRGAVLYLDTVAGPKSRTTTMYTPGEATRTRWSRMTVKRVCTPHTGEGTRGQGAKGQGQSPEGRTKVWRHRTGTPPRNTQRSRPLRCSLPSQANHGAWMLSSGANTRDTRHGRTARLCALIHAHHTYSHHTHLAHETANARSLSRATSRNTNPPAPQQTGVRTELPPAEREVLSLRYDRISIPSSVVLSGKVLQQPAGTT